MENQALVHVIRNDQARVNITYGGANGELPDPVSVDANDADLRGMITEALRAGSIPGITADAGADLRDFVVDRFPASEARPYNLIMLRPKTAFGMVGSGLSKPRGTVTCSTCGGSGHVPANLTGYSDITGG